ncbi:hypothetical protein GCM10027535_37670 [Mycolicibacterium hippocampi]
MTSNNVFGGVSAARVAGMPGTFHAFAWAHPAAAIPATAAIAAPRKRRAAAGTIAASVNRGSI